LITGCDKLENPLDPDKGKLVITSTPALADVYVNGTNSGKKTGDTLSLATGTYNITLKKTLYSDTTFSVTVIKDQTVSKSVTMKQASFTVNSAPDGAQIYLNGVNTNVVTNGSIHLAAGTNTITLVLAGYADTTFTVPADSASKTVNITLTQLNLAEYKNVKIYESQSTAAVPSGLILSVGRASTISSGISKDSVDIYYKTNGYLISSAKDFPNLPRETYFKLGSATIILDGVDSPAKDNTWALSISDAHSEYFFLYDASGHYSKMIITGTGGGTSVSDPAYLELHWFYNKNQGDKRF